MSFSGLSFAAFLEKEQKIMRRTQGFATVTLALLIVLPGTGLFVAGAARVLGFRPPPIQSSEVFNPQGSPKIPRDKPLRVMSWNIQFLAGEYFPYWEDGNNQQLHEQDIARNLDKIIRVIREVDPDILQLQEVHFTHPITFHKNQLDMLYRKLSDRLPCYSHASYWQATFAPHRRLMGNIDMRLVTMSRYQMDEAIQKLLPATRKKRAHIPFYPRHSLLEVRLPFSDGGSIKAINTHLDAPGIGRGSMYEQIDAVQRRLQLLTDNKRLWFISGDFNLIPPNFYHRLPDNQKPNYAENSLLIPFYERFRGVPELADIQGPDWKHWLTAYDLNRDDPDLIIDYIFRPGYIQAMNSRVIHLSMDISDHMPVVTELIFPPRQNLNSPESGL